MLSLGACGGGEPHRGVDAEPEMLTQREDELRAALITEDDLPDGFAESDLGEGVDSDLEGCPALHDSTGSDAMVEAVFKDGVVYVSESLLDRPSGRAAESLAALARVPEDCPEMTVSVMGMDLELRAEALESELPGEQSVALRLVGEVEGFEGLPNATVEEHAAAMQRGGVVIMVTVATVGEVDDELVNDVARAAYDKAAVLE